MFEREKANEEGNFWISYADLMAGLLFIFILLIGAIVSKTTILKSDLHTKEIRLSSISSKLKEKEKRLNETQDNLMENKKLLMEKNASLLEKKELLMLKSTQLAEANNKIKMKNEIIAQTEHILKLKQKEIEKLNGLLLESSGKTSVLNQKMAVIKDRLSGAMKASKEKNQTIETYKKKILLLSNKLNNIENTLHNKEDKLVSMLNIAEKKRVKYDKLMSSLELKKEKIKSLTGIKLKVISALKKALGDKIDIDKKTGSLKLASSILFEKGKARLKGEAKIELKKAFEQYIGTLMTSGEIQPHLDKIIVEGHTDSDGSYIYNLNLSQKRALAVMEYLLTLDFSKKYNIRPLITASGRAYLDPIKVNGVEDKEASRRIEIKFRLKNDDAMHEIEKVLNTRE